MTLIGVFIALTAAGSFIRIPLPLVPLSLQTLFPLLAGLVLPPRAAMTTQAGYLLLGLVGVPVFAQGGGPAYVLRPTFGYLLALPAAAYGIARLARRRGAPPGWLRRWLYCFAGALFILAVGAGYLYLASNVAGGMALSWRQAAVYSFLVFLPGEAIKSLLAAFLAPKIGRIINGRSGAWQNM